METRKNLLKRVASGADWRGADRPRFQGECWVETRNTLYGFRDGTCVQILSTDPTRKGHGAALLGMQLVGWVHGDESRSILSAEWVRGSYALLWRPEQGGTEAMAMTSRTTSFTFARSPANRQETHDRSPPADSLLLRRAIAPTPFAPLRRPRPSHASVTR